jgi:hypothetical protein
MHPLGEMFKTALPAGINLQSKKSATNEGETVSGGRKVRMKAGIARQRHHAGKGTGQQEHRRAGADPY